jgi:hypothetical protein
MLALLTYALLCVPLLSADLRPPAEDVALLPSHETCAENYRASLPLLEQWRVRAELRPWDEELHEAVKECEKLRWYWYHAEAATRPMDHYGGEDDSGYDWPDKNWRRNHLEQYRDLVGREAYYARHYPPVAPWWRFER